MMKRLPKGRRGDAEIVSLDASRGPSFAAGAEMFMGEEVAKAQRKALGMFG
jgi:hypothetical protein